jgi:hypothetical protein
VAFTAAPAPSATFIPSREPVAPSTSSSAAFEFAAAAEAARPAATTGGERREASPGENSLADVFRALLAVERGDAGAATPEPRPAPPGDLVEEVTRRVLERLAPDAARDLLEAVVTEVTERVVREEGRKR